MVLVVEEEGEEKEWSNIQNILYLAVAPFNPECGATLQIGIRSIYLV